MRKILCIILLFSCGPSRELAYEKYEKERKEAIIKGALEFTVRFTFVEDAEEVSIGEEKLKKPFEFLVLPGNKYIFTIKLKKSSYTGEIYVKEEGGDYGKYPGYDIPISKELREYVDKEGEASFFVTSPDRKKNILQIVIRREK